jgi:SAM-dependent methyltransferase
MGVIVRPLSPAYQRFLNEDRTFDLKYGTDTAGDISVVSLDIPDELQHHVNKYQGITAKTFNSLLSHLSIDFDKFAFIDIGSGKGRALLLASAFPFRRIIGVELSSALTEVARANVRTYRDPLQKCRDIECICSDATGFHIPLDNTLFYLFNPFDGSIMQKFINNLEQSLQQQPRDVILVYHMALHPEALDRSGYFKKIKDGGIFRIYATSHRASM